jgi:hypothetical protein
MYGYVTTVANVLLNTPVKNAIPGDRTPCPPFAATTTPLTLSNTPYVMAGLTVNTNPGFKPVHNPAIPSSSMISLAVSMSVGAGLSSCFS